MPPYIRPEKHLRHGTIQTATGMYLRPGPSPYMCGLRKEAAVIRETHLHILPRRPAAHIQLGAPAQRHGRPLQRTYPGKPLQGRGTILFPGQAYPLLLCNIIVLLQLGSPLQTHTLQREVPYGHPSRAVLRKDARGDDMPVPCPGRHRHGHSGTTSLDQEVETWIQPGGSHRTRHSRKNPRGPLHRNPVPQQKDSHTDAPGHQGKGGQCQVSVRCPEKHPARHTTHTPGGRCVHHGGHLVRMLASRPDSLTRHSYQHSHTGPGKQLTGNPFRHTHLMMKKRGGEHSRPRLRGRTSLGITKITSVRRIYV